VDDKSFVAAPMAQVRKFEVMQKKQTRPQGFSALALSMQRIAADFWRYQQ
jgi:hypothetical protein